MHTADMISCMSLEGLNGDVSPLRDGAQRQRPYPRQIETAAALRSYLEGSYLYEPSEGRPLQDPLSFRCVSQVHGAVRTAMDYARENLEITRACFWMSETSPPAEILIRWCGCLGCRTSVLRFPMYPRCPVCAR